MGGWLLMFWCTYDLKRFCAISNYNARTDCGCIQNKREKHQEERSGKVTNNCTFVRRVNIKNTTKNCTYRLGHDGSRPMGPRWSSADVVRQMSYRKIVMPLYERVKSRSTMCVVVRLCTHTQNAEHTTKQNL